MKRFGKSFVDAFRGIFVTIRDERNIKVMLAGMLFMIGAGFLCQIEPWQWTAIVICFALVLSLELHNTSIEELADAITEEQNEHIGHGKDAGAGSVLVASIFSFIVGAITFLNKETLPILQKSIADYTWAWWINLIVFLLIIALAVVQDVMKEKKKK